MRNRLLLLAIICFLLVSCASKKDVKKADIKPGDLYVEGVEMMKKKKYDKAIENFSKVRENFPFDPISFVATVKLGDAQFEKKQYAQAAGIYEDFVNTHPEDENIPYVLRRLGECYQKESRRMDQDQANTLKAIERFTFLKNRYPNSMYAKDVDAQLKNLYARLASREFYVGEFYYRTFKYNAAIIRLEYFISKYPDAKEVDGALFYLSGAYRELANPEKSQYYLDKLKKDFPNSVYARSTTRERKSLQMAKAEKSAMSAKAQEGAQAGTGTLVAFPLTEKKRKEIDLRPPATVLSQTEVAPGEAKAGTPEAAKKAGESKPIGSDGEKEESKKSPFGFFNEKKPVDVVADSMEGLENGKVIIFKGNVITKQGDLSLFSNDLTAYMNQETNEIDKADARGSVKIVKEERTATCDEASFDNSKGEITLKGNVIVFSGADKMTGDTVIYYINEDRVVVTGEKEKRAKITVNPKQ